MEISTYLPILPEILLIEGDAESREVCLNGEWLRPNNSQKIYNHSQDFCWGYTGSGPAQLALAILLYYLPIDLAYEYHQEFKNKVIAALPKGDFRKQINLRSILSSIANIPVG